MTKQTLLIYVQPRASKSEVVGMHGDAIKIRLAAPPVDGEANDELIRFVAKALGVPQRSVMLVKGHTSRTKMLEIEGMSEAEAKKKLCGS